MKLLMGLVLLLGTSLVIAQQTKPHMATGRDYLDNPASLNGLNMLYQAEDSKITRVTSRHRKSVLPK